jgi:hypothetical protein
MNEKMKNYTFEEWKKIINDIVFISIGYILDDLPDEDFRINYDNGIYYGDMAKIVIDNFEKQFLLN